MRILLVAVGPPERGPPRLAGPHCGTLASAGLTLQRADPTQQPPQYLRDSGLGLQKMPELLPCSLSPLPALRAEVTGQRMSRWLSPPFPTELRSFLS